MKNTRDMLSELASAACMIEGKGTSFDEADMIAQEFRNTYRGKIESLGYYLDAEPVMKNVNGKILCHSIEAIIYPGESPSSIVPGEALKNAGNELPSIFRQKPVVISYSPFTAAYWLRIMR